MKFHYNLIKFAIILFMFLQMAYHQSYTLSPGSDTAVVLSLPASINCLMERYTQVC